MGFKDMVTFGQTGPTKWRQTDELADMGGLMTHEQAVKEMHYAFSQFERNGRWGTCGECPVIGLYKYPEFCKNSHRADHGLTFTQLVMQYQQRVKEG